MLRVPISSVERLLSEVSKEVRNKFMSAPIESLSMHLYTFKLYVNEEPELTLIIYQYRYLIFLINPGTFLIEEVIYIKECIGRIWCNTNGQVLMHYRIFNGAIQMEDVKELRQIDSWECKEWDFPLLLW